MTGPYSPGCMQSVPTRQYEASTLTQQIVDRVRLDIVRNVLAPGSRVTEEALAERYGVSRTPVREALRVLSREELLLHTPRAGYSVASVNLDEMDDLYAIRVSIEERVSARLATVGELAPLRDLLEFWGNPPAQWQADVNLVFADEQFHETLAIASGSAVLAPILRNINYRVHALRIRDFADAERVRLTYEQHAMILRALLDRDSRLGAALLRSHIWQSYAFVRSSIRAEEGP